MVVDESEVDPLLRVDVDLNSRSWDGLVRAGFENCRAPVGVGMTVLAWQSDDDLIADAVVESVDPSRQLIYLRVKWDTMRDDDDPPRRFSTLMGDVTRRRLVGLAPPLAVARSADWIFPTNILAAF